MSRISTSGLAAAVAATAVACLLTATPAHAAAKAPAASGQPGSVTGVADWEKSPNVTVTVIGKLPKLSAQRDVYSQDAAIPSKAAATTLAASTVPFDFALYGVWSYPGRDFTSTETVVCKDIAIRYTGGGPGTPPASNFQVSLSSGGWVRVPIDNVARSFCFSGVPVNTTVHFYYHMVDEPNPGSYSKVDGSGRVRYSWQ